MIKKCKDFYNLKAFVMTKNPAALSVSLDAENLWQQVSCLNYADKPECMDILGWGLRKVNDREWAVSVDEHYSLVFYFEEPGQSICWLMRNLELVSNESQK